MKALKTVCKYCKHQKTCTELCSFAEWMLNNTSGFCDKCSKKESCTRPCFFAEAIAGSDGLTYLEKNSRNSDGDLIRVIYSSLQFNHEKNFTSIQNEDTEGDSFSPVDNFTAEDLEEFYKGVFYTRSSQIGIFIDRFFNSFSYEDLAVKYEISEREAVNRYYKAKQDFFYFLETWNEEKDKLHARRIAEANIKDNLDMPKSPKCFILRYCLGLTHAEIAKILEMDRKSVSRAIKDIERDLKNGIRILGYENGKVRALTVKEKKSQISGNLNQKDEQCQMEV